MENLPHEFNYNQERTEIKESRISSAEISPTVEEPAAKEDALQEISSIEAKGQVIEGVITTELADMSREKSREQIHVDSAVASYLREKGEEFVLERYRRMSDSTRNQFKEWIAAGNLRPIVYAMEKNEQIQELESESSLPIGTNLNEITKENPKRKEALIALWGEMEKQDAIANRHRAIAEELRQRAASPEAKDKSGISAPPESNRG